VPIDTDTIDIDHAEWSRIVLEALRGEDPASFDALVSHVTPDELVDLASSEHGATWARVPRHSIPADYRLLLLHAAARLFLYDGAAPHLDGAFFEAMVASLVASDAEWADAAAHLWSHWLIHTGETETVWPQAEALLLRFPDQLGARPRLLGSIALIASICGASEADGLWTRALAHPMLGDHASQRWELELDWARGHLMLGAADPMRAIIVLRRVRAGFAELNTSTAELAAASATLELICALALVGQCDAALELVEDSIRQVQPGGELELWLRAVGAYPAAHLGDAERAREGIDAAERAATDTSSLRARAVLPARALLAAAAGDVEGIEAVIGEGFRLEAGRPLDRDLRAIWRLHAAEACVLAGMPERARDLVDSLDAALVSAPGVLRLLRIRRDHVAASLGAGELVSADVAERARTVGMLLPALTPADADHVGSVDALSISVLGPLSVAVGGVEAPDRLWAGRRQARVLLAAIVARGGRIERDEVAELMWGDIDTRTANARIAPLCNSIRAVLAHADATTGTSCRELVTRGDSIILQLGPDDTCDLATLRAVHASVGRTRSHSLDAIARVVRGCGRRPIADLGTANGAAEVRQQVEDEVRLLVPALVAQWHGRAAPTDIVDVARRLFDAEPTNAAMCAALMQLLHDAGDTAGASAAFHQTRQELRGELGLTPPLELVRLHASLIEDVSATTAS
jgi:DNA-binding SARP family transcriptional activator